jgi:hypothetical protein
MMFENRLKVFVVALGLGVIASPALADENTVYLRRG